MRVTGIIVAALGLALLGCSREGGGARGEADAPKTQGHPLDGVWDFVTSVNWTATGTAYLRGTLYVKTENNQTVCALTAFQESETRNFLVEGLTEATSSAEQDCQIFANGAEFSIKSSVRRGKDGYVPDDFSLTRRGNDVLAGRLISNHTLETTFVRRGSGLNLAQPWRMVDRDKANSRVAPFAFLAHGKTGCVFGVSAVKQTDDAEGGIVFDFRRFCRDNEASERLTDAKDFFELQQGYYLSCQKRMAYNTWRTTFRDNGLPIRTLYADVTGHYTEITGQPVPSSGEESGEKRIPAAEMAAKGFTGESVDPGSMLGLIVERNCR